MAAPGVIAQDAKPWSSAEGTLHPSLLAGLTTMGYQYMTPVQQKVLFERPHLHSDCLVQAKTGTGKTIAFLLPALHSLLTQPRLPKGQVAILIISPTRELALQIAKECDSVTAKVQPRIECHAVYGGSSKERFLKQFREGDPKVTVATPGRLNDYLSEPSIAKKFANIRTLVLDEADQMLEAGFLDSINLILQRLPPKSQGWNGMCFSATMPDRVEGVLPKVLAPGHARLSTVSRNETPTIDQVEQHFVVVPGIQDVYRTLHAMVEKEYELSPEDFKIIVFGTTANNVALMYSLFAQLLHGRMAVFQLQSRLSQNARTRTTEEFKAAPAGIMFASDVIGRGMDFPNVSHVVQVGLPSSGEQYVHRVGRTARAGNAGRAIILLTERESFFLNTNKHLPIKSYPYDLSAASQQQSAKIAHAFDSLEPSVKAKAYQAWLGFHKTYTKKLQLDNEGLVRLANEHAAVMGCPEPPMIDKRVVGKMGLKGVRGLNIGSVDQSHGFHNAGSARQVGSTGNGTGGRGGQSTYSSHVGVKDRSRIGADQNGPSSNSKRRRGHGRGGKASVQDRGS